MLRSATIPLFLATGTRSVIKYPFVCKPFSKLHFTTLSLPFSHKRRVMSEPSKEKTSRPLEVSNRISTATRLDSLSLQMQPPPDYLKTRIEIFDRIKAEYDAMIAGMFRIGKGLHYSKDDLVYYTMSFRIGLPFTIVPISLCSQKF